MKEASPARVEDPADPSKERLLAIAESLFADQGVEGTSLRELTAKAGLHVGAVNYHFRSKEALAEAVFERLSVRVNARRVAELERLLAEAAAAGRPPALEALLDSFIRPYVDPVAPRDGALLARLILQHRIAPSPMTMRIIQRHFDPMAKQYIAALALAQPAIDPVEHYWRYTFMVSAVVLTVTDQGESGSRLARLSGGKADVMRSEDLRRYLLRFLKDGFAGH